MGCDVFLMKFLVNMNEPYPQLRHKIKMAAIGGGLCTESLWGKTF